MPETYRIIRSQFAYNCAKCGVRWELNDLIYVCNKQYFCRSGCLREAYPNAILEREEEEKGKKEDSTIMAVSSEDNGQRVAVTVKWELVATADDIIVLRRR